MSEKKKKGTSSKDEGYLIYPSKAPSQSQDGRKSPEHTERDPAGDDLRVGEDCSLRAARRIECNPLTCSSKCRNQRSQRKEFAECLWLDSAGTRLETRCSIPKGNLVIQYIGVKRFGVPKINQAYAYPLTEGRPDKNLYVDCEKQGYFGRFIRHSEEPNCEAQTWAVDKLLRLLIVAREDIAEGEELTLCYPQKSPSSWARFAGPIEAELTRPELKLKRLLQTLSVPDGEEFNTHKWILEDLGFRYFHTNVYNPRQKAMVNQKTDEPSSKSAAGEPFPEDDGPIFQIIRAAILQKHFSKRGKSPEQELSCSCEGNPAGEGCGGEECSLRASRVECSQLNCSSPCRNQRVQRDEFQKCLHFVAKCHRKLFLVPSASISKATLIVEYIGELTQGAPHLNQPFAYPLKDYNRGKDIYVNSKQIGNESRFIYPSEKPNCEVQEWVVDGKVRLLVFAKEDISAGDVLTLKYPHWSACYRVQKTVEVILPDIRITRSKYKANPEASEMFLLKHLNFYYSNTNVYTPRQRAKVNEKKGEERSRTGAGKQFPEDGGPIFRAIRAAIIKKHFSKHGKSHELSCSCESNPAGEGCAGGDCSLRANQIECDQLNCSSPCRNQRVQREEFPEYLHISVRNWTNGRGELCVVAPTGITRGNLVAEYVGELKSGALYHNQPCAYPLKDYNGGKDLYISSEKIGNESRFIQHSEEPNCEVQEWVVDKKVRLLVVALEDIAEDEVITLRYPQMSSSSGAQYARLTEAEITCRELELERLSLNPTGPSRASSGNKPNNGKSGRTKKKGHSPDATHVCRYGSCKKGFPTPRELEEHHEEFHHAVLPDNCPDDLTPERETETLVYFPGMENLDGETLGNRLQQVKSYIDRAELDEITRLHVEAVKRSRTVEEVSDVVQEESTESPGLEDMDCEALKETEQNLKTSSINNNADESVIIRQHAQAVMRSRTEEEVSANIRRQLGQGASDYPLDSDSD